VIFAAEQVANARTISSVSEVPPASDWPATPDAAEPVVNRGRPADPMVAAMRREPNPLRRALIVLGPGLVTGASDDDPSGIATYAQAGASYGYSTLWTTLLMLPMMAAVQYISAKVGIVSGRGLAGALRQHYPRAIVYPAVLALVVANTVNAGADIGAIAAAINLLVPRESRLAPRPGARCEGRPAGPSHVALEEQPGSHERQTCCHEVEIRDFD
jgi:hypothetical protein